MNEIPDDELSIPRATLNKMIKELLPDIRVSIDSRELISNCCTEFITLISTEANNICNIESKKTISPEHVIIALANLGFNHFIDDAKEVMKSTKNMAIKKRKGSSKLENLGIPEEELYRQQQELFAKGRKEQEQRDHDEWIKLQEALNQTASRVVAGPGDNKEDENNVTTDHSMQPKIEVDDDDDYD